MWWDRAHINTAITLAKREYIVFSDMTFSLYFYFSIGTIQTVHFHCTYTVVITDEMHVILLHARNCNLLLYMIDTYLLKSLWNWIQFYWKISYYRSLPSLYVYVATCICVTVIFLAIDWNADFTGLFSISFQIQMNLCSFTFSNVFLLRFIHLFFGATISFDVWLCCFLFEYIQKRVCFHDKLSLYLHRKRNNKWKQNCYFIGNGRMSSNYI